MRAGAGMAQLIMNDWKRFFESHGVQLKGVCRAAKGLIQAAQQPADEVGRLNARVAELEAELARIKAGRGAPIARPDRSAPSEPSGPSGPSVQPVESDQS